MRSDIPGSGTSRGSADRPSSRNSRRQVLRHLAGFDLFGELSPSTLSLHHLNKAPAKPLDPPLLEFVKYILSRVGQTETIKSGFYPITRANTEQGPPGARHFGRPRTEKRKDCAHPTESLPPCGDPRARLRSGGPAAVVKRSFPCRNRHNGVKVSSSLLRTSPGDSAMSRLNSTPAQRGLQ